VKSREKNKRKPAKRASAWAASERFNEQLFSVKLLELLPLPRIDGSFFPTNAAIDSYPVSLHERLEGIDRICRGIWQIQGEPVTTGFVSEVLERKVMAQIDAVVGESVIRSSATDLERWGPAWAYLAREVGDLRSEFANHYEIEVRELEYKQAPTPEPESDLAPATTRAKGGRHRNDNDREMIRKKLEEGKDWKRVTKEMDVETGHVRSMGAYRYLWNTDPLKKSARIARKPVS
jgi:hypothetical protein